MTDKNTINNYYLDQRDAIKLNISEKRDAEQCLGLIAPEYMGVYIVDRENDSFRNVVGPGFFSDNDRNLHYSDALKIYRDRYVLEGDREIISKLLNYNSIYETLLAGKEIKLSYRKKDGAHVGLRVARYSQLEEEKNLSIWIYSNEKIKDELQAALDEAELKNEILSAIGKSYLYISRIDIEEDYYEVVSGIENFHNIIEKEGCFSANTPENCKKIVADAYLDDLIAFLDVSTIADRLQDVESVSMEYRLLNGGWHTARLIAKKRDEHGRVTHVLGAIRNISDEKRTEQQLRSKAAEAKHEAMEKSRFLSNMSHDIRTPINGIIGMIDIADQYPNDQEVQNNCKKKIKQLSGYLVSIVNDILDMNKLQSDDFVIPNMPFDLTDMLKSANADAQTKAEKKNIEYVIDWDKCIIDHQYLLGNPIYVAKILAIMADNAIKFSDSDSRVAVWCKEKRIDDEKLSYTFFCEDHGCGMSEEFAQHAFDMFSQEDESNRTNYKGTGLGLAIAKGLSDKLGGTMNLESKKGVGTTVSAEFVFKACSADDIKAVGDYNNISLEGLHVLVVEDNEINMEIAKFLLEDQGMIVECASDGEEAIAMFEKSEPGYYDVILMDIMMPKLNGLNATKKIRKLKRKDAGSIPIIAMSANSFAEDKIKSSLAGMNAHLSKPLDVEQVVRTISYCSHLRV